MFQCLTHGWTSPEKPCPECEKARLDYEIRRNRGGPRCKLCGRGEGKYAGWCSECMSDHDL